MAISELDYENMQQKWLETQSHIGDLNKAYFLFINSLFTEDETEASQNMERALTGETSWIKSNFSKFPKFQNQMREILDDREAGKQLIVLKRLLPFTPKKINNISEKSVFWVCVDMLKNATEANQRLIGDHITKAIENSINIDDQLILVLSWLNLFGYYPDKLARIERIRSNFSDALHGTYAIACDGLLTLDKNFAKRIAAAMSALRLETAVGSNAKELLHQITQKSGRR